MVVSRRGLFALDFGVRSRTSGQWLRVHRTAMACRFEVTLPPDDAVHVPAAAAALDEADRIEDLLSVFRDHTEVSRLNRTAAQGAVGVSPELHALIALCARLHAATEGAFDITSTPLSRCWGFLQREGRVPDPDALDAARRLAGMARLKLADGEGTVMFDRPGVELSFGAIGKGYAVDRMGAHLRRAGVEDALISAGGSSVLAMGSRGAGWPVDIRSPLTGPERLARLTVRHGAIGTSGAGEQFIVESGRRYGHVIDPRTGVPADGVVSCTVVAGDAAHADALSTAFLIGGPDLARRYCDAHPGTLALLVLDGQPRHPRILGCHPGARIEA
jgi:thiamine biosynthesis lipoprotein